MPFFQLTRKDLTEALQSINPRAPHQVTNDIAHRLLHAIEDIARTQPFGTSFAQGHEVDDNGHDNYHLRCELHGGSGSYTVRYDDGTTESFPKRKPTLEELNAAQPQPQPDKDDIHQHTTAGPHPGVSQKPSGKDWTNPQEHIKDIVKGEVQKVADSLRTERVLDDLLGGDPDNDFRRELIARARALVTIIESQPTIDWPQNARTLKPALDAYEANLNSATR